MSADLTTVSGIGDTMAEVLAESGIKTVRALSKMSVNELVQVKGFSDAKARSVIASALELVGSGHSPTPAAKSTPASVAAATPAVDEGQKEDKKKAKKKAAKSKDEKKGKGKKKGKKGKKKK